MKRYKCQFFRFAGDGGLTRADLEPLAITPTGGRQVFSLDMRTTIRKSSLSRIDTAYFNSLFLYP